MKKLLIFVYSAFVVIMLANFFYYRNLYNKQINYITTLLDRQVQIAGLSVDNTNNYFLSDLNKISFSDDLALFFTDNEKQYRAKENMKLFFSKYQDLVTGMKLYDDKRNEYTLKKDDMGDWLEQLFILHVQGEIIEMEKLVLENKIFDYYQPLIKNNITVGNIVVSIDYQKYFDEIFSVFNLKDYQWQWVVSDSGEIVYNNFSNKIIYSEIGKITSAIESGSIANTIHKAVIDGKTKEIISSYYSTQLIQRNIGLVFSAPTDFFQKYLIWNSLFIVLGTLLLIQIIIYIFWRYLKSRNQKQNG
jgi:hypothetical protein